MIVAPEGCGVGSGVVVGYQLLEGVCYDVGVSLGQEGNELL